MGSAFALCAGRYYQASREFGTTAVEATGARADPLPAQTSPADEP